jgi:hypothetical protein
MKTLFAILLATLCAATSYGQTLKTVMVNTNGVVQFPTNFWTTNAGTNFQRFVATNNFSYSAPTLNYSTNRGQYLLREQNVLNVLRQTNLGIDLPHVLLAVGNDLWAFRRAAPTTGTPNATGVLFSNAVSSFSNSTVFTFTNASHIPEAVYDPTRGRIYAASVTAGVFSIAISNNAVTSFATNNIDIGGSIAQDADHLYLGWSNVVQKLAKSNGVTIATITNTNLSDIHALQVTPDLTKLVGATAGNPAKAFVVTLSNFAFQHIAEYSNTNAFTFTDDFAVDNTNAFLSAEGGNGALLRYNLASNSFTEIATAGSFYFVTEMNGVLYAGGPSGAVSFSKDGSIYTEFYTANSLWNEMAVIGTNVFATDYTVDAVVAQISWSSSLTRMSRAEADFAPVVTNLVLSNTNSTTVLQAGTFKEGFVWMRVTPQVEAGNVNVLNYMNANNQARKVGDRLIVQNIGTNTLNVRRGIGSSPTIIRTLPPGQIFEATAVGVSATDTTWFTNTIAAQAIPALTNTSNVTVMRALAGSTNTNQPFSGTVEYHNHAADPFFMEISNGIILRIYE